MFFADFISLTPVAVINIAIATYIFGSLLANHHWSFTEMCETFMISASFRIIYAMSVVQMRLESFSKIASLPATSTATSPTFECILDGKLVRQTNTFPSIMIIYSPMQSQLKKIITSRTWDASIQCVKTDFKFIMCELHVGNEVYRIDFAKKHKFNYYVVGNIIDKAFIQYYMTQHGVGFPDTINDTTSVRLKIIDHRVVSFEIDLTNGINYILLFINGYLCHVPNDAPEEQEREREEACIGRPGVLAEEACIGRPGVLAEEACIGRPGVLAEIIGRPGVLAAHDIAFLHDITKKNH